jgi:hypothetical protein
MVNVGGPMDDAKVMQIMLNALPSNYGNFIQICDKSSWSALLWEDIEETTQK